ncbi:glutamine amidotransferase [Methyloceanibacter methanicus]|uniref:Glutamine amidotransferase n=1 Tax=Methyloceanibacter methanicus TaxID=1774968 RepID=A0A1E3W2W8_9HYPH|nr:glutamine amidotransferase [Methyloceanibacter methanicus]ODR99851.1 glutamine amidotransferase [Methyloceanibacter methanicus]
MKTAVAIYHVAFEDAGTLQPVLEERGYYVTYLQAGRDDLAPAREADLVLVLGGPIGIYELDRYPFLKDELKLIEAVMNKGTPVIGICLGAQALAAVLAARVYPGAEKEIGWSALHLTDEGKASPLAALDGLPVLHWHGDIFDLPAGATRLAATDITPTQAFSFGPNVLALQFHVELPARDIERWLIGHTVELANAHIDLAQMRADTARYAPAVNAASRTLVDAWLDALPHG